MLPTAEDRNVHSNLWWLFGEFYFKCPNTKTVKAEMDSCNSSYKVGCVEPEAFQQLIADRFLQKEIAILKSHPLNAFSRLMSLVLVLLFC